MGIRQSHDDGAWAKPDAQAVLGGNRTFFLFTVSVKLQTKMAVSHVFWSKNLKPVLVSLTLGVFGGVGGLTPGWDRGLERSAFFSVFFAFRSAGCLTLTGRNAQKKNWDKRSAPALGPSQVLGLQLHQKTPISMKPIQVSSSYSIKLVKPSFLVRVSLKPSRKKKWAVSP